jgi:hypothetical protein
MKFSHLLLCAVFFFISGCGQDHSASSNPTPPSQSITGTYKLSSASGTYVYQGGTLSLDLASSITGTLILEQGSWNETFVVDSGTYSKNGTYIINYTNGTVEGNIGMTYSNGSGIYSFSINGYNLNLTGDPNSSWTKISDQVVY